MEGTQPQRIQVSSDLYCTRDARDIAPVPEKFTFPKCDSHEGFVFTDPRVDPYSIDAPRLTVDPHSVKSRTSAMTHLPGASTARAIEWKPEDLACDESRFRRWSR
jgi:hypothetical protein